MKTEDVRDAAWDALAEHIGGLNRRMWRHHAGLTPAQLSRAINALRDLFDDRLPFVRVRRGGEWIYVLAFNDRDVREYYSSRLHSQITRARRDYNEMHGFAKEHPSTENQWQEELARRRVGDLTRAYDTFQGQDVLGGLESR